MSNRAGLGLLALALASACDLSGQYCEGPVIPAEDVASAPRARLVAQVLPTASNAVDTLFVIDDPMSMTDEQQQLGIWSSKLFDVLAGSSGELPDLHIAV